MPDAPDIVLCSKLCRYYPADPNNNTAAFSKTFNGYTGPTKIFSCLQKVKGSAHSFIIVIILSPLLPLSPLTLESLMHALTKLTARQ